MVGQWMRVPVAAISVQAGDTFNVIGNVVQQIRAGIVIAERTLALPGEAINPWPALGSQTITEFLYFKETKMAGIAISLTNVSRGTGDVIYANFSNGDQLETSIADMQARKASLNENVGIAQNILLAKLITAQPAMDNPDAMNGSTVSIDADGANPINFIEA